MFKPVPFPFLADLIEAQLDPRPHRAVGEARKSGPPLLSTGQVHTGCTRSLTLGFWGVGSEYFAAIVGAGFPSHKESFFPFRFISYRLLMATMSGQSSTAIVTSMTCMKR